jgi:hypothetical protein
MTLEDPTAVTTKRHNWLGEEAAQPGVRRELGRLLRRARRRWLRTLLYALACTALAVVAVARHPPLYVSRVVLRAAAGPALRELVVKILASNAAARDGLDVELVGPGRVALTLRGTEPQKVFDDVTALGRLVTDWRPDPSRKARGPRFAMADPGHVAQVRPGGAMLLWCAGALAFVVALLVSAVAVGAFDPLVYELEDVERLGLPALGALRGFDGDNAGALASRLARVRIDRS